jgi:hypothetical protein
MKKKLLALIFISILFGGCAENACFKTAGGKWPDTDGVHINAHSPGFLYHEGTYYWYGQQYDGKTYLPDCNKDWIGTRVDATGVACYSSKDLYNWKNEGLALSAIKDDLDHDLHTSKVIERPKVIYNAKTKKFVMWMHIDSMDYSKAATGVAISDSPTGPFKYVHGFRPNAGLWPINVTKADKTSSENNRLKRDQKGGQMARDMTLFVDDDGKAYHFYSSEDNITTHVSLLTDDYLRAAGKYKRLFIDRSMEAQVVFKRGGKYYFIASGCTGWEPNPARSAVADSIWGPWKELGNPCVGKNADKTFNAQSTYVLKVHGKDDAFIFISDGWKPYDLMDSRYLWLPIEFDGDRIIVKWQDDWDMSVFD